MVCHVSVSMMRGSLRTDQWTNLLHALQARHLTLHRKALFVLVIYTFSHLGSLHRQAIEPASQSLGPV